MNIEALLQEDRKRTAALAGHYDPIRGVGSPLPRLEVLWEPGGPSLLLPSSMFAAPCPAAPVLAWARRKQASVREAIEASGLPWEGYEHVFNALREEYDFEFWAALRVTVKDRRGRIVPYRLFPAQRKLLAECERQREAEQPIRLTVLKHRRLGSTTFFYTYIAWHQFKLYEGRDAWFMGLDKAGAEEVRHRYDTIRQAAGLNVRNLDQTGNTRQLVERGCMVSVGSVERPNAPSGRDAHYVHLFEIGKWPSNQTVSAERVMQNMASMCPDIPGTVYVLDSSAQGGVGTFFKEVCDRAQSGEKGEGEAPMAFLFVGVPSDPALVDYVPDPEAFATTLSEKELAYIQNDGATLGHIAWRRRKAQEPAYYDDWRLTEEYPFNALEAFQTGERRVFPVPYVAAARKTCKPEAARGRLFAQDDKGKGAFKGLHFEPDPRGPLRIWRFPHDDYRGRLKPDRISNRYAGALDVGGTWTGADPSDIPIMDRAPRLLGGEPEIVAEWHGRLDADLVAYEAARVCYWYDRARLIVESNKYEQNPADNEGAPDDSATVLEVLHEHYDNLYVRQSPADHLYEEPTERVGFQTNKATKPAMIGQLKAWLRRAAIDHGLVNPMADEGEIGYYTERWFYACAEMDTFLYHIKNGRTIMGAAAKKHDDTVIGRALLAFLDGEMDPVRYAAPVEKPKRVSAGMASV